MSDYRPAPLDENIADLDQLRKRVHERVRAACRQAGPFDLFTDPPFASLPAMMFVLRCDLAVMLLWAAALLALLFSPLIALVLAALGVVAFVLRWVVHFWRVAPVRRRLAECRVLPAVVVQAYDGGWLPPDEDPGKPLFTGVVVFSFDESTTIARLRSLGKQCFAAKTGPDDGPMAALKRLLLTGDHEFVHDTFRLPAAVAGNDVTYATPIMFHRDNDLAEGHLSTAAQLILAHPRVPQHVCPVPLAFWDSQRSRGLLND